METLLEPREGELCADGLEPLSPGEVKEEREGMDWKGAETDMAAMGTISEEEVEEAEVARPVDDLRLRGEPLSSLVRREPPTDESELSTLTRGETSNALRGASCRECRA
jgi:hypothetical protein